MHNSSLNLRFNRLIELSKYMYNAFNIVQHVVKDIWANIQAWCSQLQTLNMSPDILSTPNQNDTALMKF